MSFPRLVYVLFPYTPCAVSHRRKLKFYRFEDRLTPQPFVSPYNKLLMNVFYCCSVSQYHAHKNGMLRLIIQAISLGNAFEVDEHNIRVRCSNRNLLFLGIWTQVVLTYDSLRCLRKNQSQKSYLCFWWKPIVPSNGSMALRGINPDIIPKVAALLFRFVRNH